MKNHEKLIGLVNDLIRVNNDRYSSYSALLSRNIILDRDVWLLVCNLAAQSRSNSVQLINEAIKLRNAEGTGSSLTAGIYSNAPGLKEPIVFADRSTLLAECKRREEVVQKVYYDALSFGIELPDEMIALVSDQKREMKISASLFVVEQPASYRHAA
jgi:hypothetical protein